MGQIMGKSMRFVIHLPIATGRRLVRNAAKMGLPEYAYIATALAVGDTSLDKSTALMKSLTATEAQEMVKLLLEGRARPAAKSRKAIKKIKDVASEK